MQLATCQTSWPQQKWGSTQKHHPGLFNSSYIVFLETETIEKTNRKSFGEHPDYIFLVYFCLSYIYIYFSLLLNALSKVSRYVLSCNPLHILFRRHGIETINPTLCKGPDHVTLANHEYKLPIWSTDPTKKLHPNPTSGKVMVKDASVWSSTRWSGEPRFFFPIILTGWLRVILVIYNGLWNNHYINWIV